MAIITGHQKRNVEPVRRVTWRQWLVNKIFGIDPAGLQVQSDLTLYP